MTTPQHEEGAVDRDFLDDMPLDVYSEADVERYEAAFVSAYYDDAERNIQPAPAPPCASTRCGGPVFEPLTPTEVQELTERRAAQQTVVPSRFAGVPAAPAPEWQVSARELEEATSVADERRQREQRAPRVPAARTPTGYASPRAVPANAGRAAQSRPRQDKPKGPRTRSTESRLTPVEQLSSVEREQRARALQETFSRYIALKDEEARLKKEKDELAAYIKEHVRAGDHAEVGGMVPVVMTQRKRAIDPQAFLETFGLEALLKCVTLNVKQVDELVKSGEIDGKEAKGLISMVDGPLALYIRPANEESNI